jgi:hypothetical protein
VIFDNSIHHRKCAHDVAAAYCLAMADVRVRLPLGASAAKYFPCGGARAGTGRRLLSASSQVRFLSPQLTLVSRTPPSKGGARGGIEVLQRFFPRSTSPFRDEALQKPASENRTHWVVAISINGASSASPANPTTRSSNGKMGRSDRLHAGSIPALVTLLEAIRPAEETVSKTAGGPAACEFESHRFRLQPLIGPVLQTGNRRRRSAVRVREGLLQGSGVWVRGSGFGSNAPDP